MDAAMQRLVWQRAGGRCEYCRLPQTESRAAFEIDHIIAHQHHGRTVSGNLALSCAFCNGYKGPNLTGRDPHGGKITPLFHPRRHKWSYHFRYEGGTLIGRTAIGRTTVDVLRINHPQRVALREILLAAGVF
jgi:HNH endonuclease